MGITRRYITLVYILLYQRYFQNSERVTNRRGEAQKAKFDVFVFNIRETSLYNNARLCIYSFCFRFHNNVIHALSIKRGSPLNRVHAQTDRADLSILVYNPIHSRVRVTPLQYIMIHYIPLYNTRVVYTRVCE